MAVKNSRKEHNSVRKEKIYAGKEQKNENQNKIRTKPHRKNACG